jgi:hypothetical protein
MGVTSFGLMLAARNRVPTLASSYALECNDCRLTFDDQGRILECRHLPTDTTFPMEYYWSNIANMGEGETLDYPEGTTVVQTSPDITDVTYHYGSGKSSTLRVTSHTYFLEFELTHVTGDCGTILMFSPIFLVEYDFNAEPGGRDQIMDIGKGFFACIIAGNEHTGLVIDGGPQVFSPPFVPSNPSYVRNQRFAFFICQEAELRQRLLDLEAYFGFPFGISIKDRSENNVDYLFLLDMHGASAQDIIALCQQTGLGSVLLGISIWSEYQTPEEPFKLQPWAKDVVRDLKASGLIVGVHSYVHKIPTNGYYATHYPGQVSTTAVDGLKSFTFDNDLPEIMAGHYAAKIKELGADWTYFDGAERLYESVDQHVDTYDGYLKTRITRAIMQALEAEGVMPVVHQQSSQGYNCYHYVSRTGQRDYWDGWPEPDTTPMKSIDWAKSQAVHRRRALMTPDLGWFGRKIHVMGNPIGERDATWEEWQYVCDASVRYNIPLGIRTSYNDFMTDPLRDQIVPLLRTTITERQMPRAYLPLILKQWGK